MPLSGSSLGVNLRAGVVGASGFIGSAVTQSLSDSGWHVVAVRAPRLQRLHPKNARRDSPPLSMDVDAFSLADDLDGCEVVINAAGDSRASSRDEGVLFAANAALPLVLREACELAGVKRFIHISSAAVQGDIEELDDSISYQPYSPYARSKALGEQWLLDCKDECPEIVIYRPPGVHAPGRTMTDSLRRLSSRGLLPVAGDGADPTPQASLANVSDAVRFLAHSRSTPPKVVHHPWEGHSCKDFLRLMGGRDPWHLPVLLADVTIQVALLSEKIWPRMAPYRRRFQILSFGQRVAKSWLSEAGWEPPVQDFWREA